MPTEPLPPESAWALSPARLLQQGSPFERGLILGAWALSLLASIVLGLLSVTQVWSALPVPFGGVTIFITVYPPLLICLWWTLAFGWWWGAIPAYAATLVLALYAGMPAGWALLFAGANPLGFAIMTLGYRAIPVERDMRSLDSVLYFIQLAFVASVFGSAGALVWCFTNRIDATAQLPIWQGWWLGSFLQSVFLVAPLLALTGPPLARWKTRRLALLRPPPGDARRPILQLILAVMLGVLVYGALTLLLGAGQLTQARASGTAATLGVAIDAMVATTWVFYWVVALLVLFGGFFGWRMFTHWQTETGHLLAELAQANVELALHARTDGLTGLRNRRDVEDQLERHWQRVLRFGERAAVVMFDLDHFKAINDQHGHAGGDVVLRALAATLGGVVRAVDVAGRWGGEEFVVILPHVDAEGARIFAERLRERVIAAPVQHAGRTIEYSISLGISVASPDDGSAQAWLRRADQALYEAKSLGRNRSVLAA